MPLYENLRPPSVVPLAGRAAVDDDADSHTTPGEQVRIINHAWRASASYHHAWPASDLSLPRPVRNPILKIEGQDVALVFEKLLQGNFHVVK